MSSPRASTAFTVQDCWDCMLPGPPSRNNFRSTTSTSLASSHSPPAAPSPSLTAVQCSSSSTSLCHLPPNPHPRHRLSRLSSPPSAGPRSLSTATSSPPSLPAPTSSSPSAIARATSPSSTSAPSLPSSGSIPTSPPPGPRMGPGPTRLLPHRLHLRILLPLPQQQLHRPMLLEIRCDARNSLMHLP
ncbi:hypothetical protein ACFX2G_024084 [Malus domestica]